MRPDISALPSYPLFRQTFQGDLTLPSDSEYLSAIQRWSSWAQREAGLVAYVKNESDVSFTIKFAVKEKLELAIKGGGHNPSGASSTIGGVVIDLSRYMNSVVVDPDAKIAHVGGGAMWMEVDDECIKYGLASVAGTVADTGVGGGGYGFLSGEHGLVIDNVVGVTMVISDGSIVSASATEHPDLYWAVRGGGSNFGVVTTFRLALHPQSKTIWAGTMTYGADQLDALFTVADKWKRDVMSPKDTLVIVFAHAPDTGSPIIECLCCHNGPIAAAETTFASFNALGPIANTTGLIPYEQLNRLLLEMNPTNQAYYMCPATQMKPAAKVFRQVFEEYVARIAAGPRYTRTVVIFEYYFASGYRTEYTDSAAFNCRGPHSNVLAQVHDAGDDPDLDGSKALAKSLMALIVAGEGNAETPYGNYDFDPSAGQDKLVKLYKNHYPRLQSIKAKYDPDMVFNKWFPIVPAAAT